MVYKCIYCLVVLQGLLNLIQFCILPVNNDVFKQHCVQISTSLNVNLDYTTAWTMCSLAAKDFKIILAFQSFDLSVPDEGDSRNAY